MYVCIYVCVCVYICVYMCVCIYKYVCIHACMNVCMHVCMDGCMHMYMYIYTYTTEGSRRAAASNMNLPTIMQRRPPARPCARAHGRARARERTRPHVHARGTRRVSRRRCCFRTARCRLRSGLAAHDQGLRTYGPRSYRPCRDGVAARGRLRRATGSKKKRRSRTRVFADTRGVGLWRCVRSVA